MKKDFPFTAIVGQEKMKSGLILNAINGHIGGILIRGQKGTAKSIAVRALANLLPEIRVVDGCPFNCDPDDPARRCPGCAEIFQDQTSPTTKRRISLVELPINATEDRVVGTLDFEHALRQGEKRFEPGLLAKANRGILYVDEVNLLDDNIVDILLDSAAMGQNIIEREGVSFIHPARFMLVGTMNPEEGELRPQLLDRFGLCTTVSGVEDPGGRIEIIKRRDAYENDPEGFYAQWEEAEQQLSRDIVAARQMLPDVSISDDILGKIARLTIETKVDGHRADLAIMKTAKTVAAFKKRSEVMEKDVIEASSLALGHRLRRNPFDDIFLDMDHVRKVILN